MSPRGVPKDKPTEPVVVNDLLSDVVDTRPEVQREEEDREADARQEFNEHVLSLVKNFVQQEVSELEGRIRDMEMVLGAVVGSEASNKAAAAPLEVGTPWHDAPDYKQEHQGGDGIGWYTS